MNLDELRARQGPLKETYRATPEAALRVLRAEGSLDGGAIVCRVPTPAGLAEAGLHEAAGGDPGSACSGDMLLQSLVACAGVTLGAVAKAIGVEIRSGRVVAEADLDFRGTLGVSKAVPVGLTAIRLRFELETDASEAERDNLLRLTERYCVIYQTLRSNPPIASTIVVR